MFRRCRRPRCERCWSNCAVRSRPIAIMSAEASPRRRAKSITARSIRAGSTARRQLRNRTSWPKRGLRSAVSLGFRRRTPEDAIAEKAGTAASAKAGPFSLPTVLRPTNPDPCRDDTRESRSGCILSQLLVQNAHDMARLAAGAFGDLVTAARAAGGQNRFRRGGAHFRQPPEFADPHRDVVMLGFETERARHAAA